MIAQGNVKLSLIWSYMFNNRLLLALEACISVFEGIAGNVLVYARVRVKENKGKKCERDEKMYVCAVSVCFASNNSFHATQFDKRQFMWQNIHLRLCFFILLDIKSSFSRTAYTTKPETAH